MTCRWLAALVTLPLVAALASPASAAERLTDKQVEQQGKAIRAGFEAWKQALEKKNLDDAVIRSAAGTIDVKDFLKAFDQELAAFTDAFRKSKSANAEALPLLRRASDVERRRRAQGGVAIAEWSALSAQFAALCAAYGAIWPIESMDATVARLNDDEIVAQIDDIERLSKRVRGPAVEAAKSSAAMDKAARDTMALEADSIPRLAKELAAKIKAGQSAAQAASQLLAVIFSLNGKLTQLTLPPAAKTDWEAVDRSAAAVARAFGEQWTGK